MLINVAVGAGLIVSAAIDLDAQRLPQDHLPILAHSITVMIMAMVTRDLALPAPCVAAQSPLLLASTTSATTCGAAPGRCQARRTSSATPTMVRGRPCDER